LSVKLIVVAVPRWNVAGPTFRPVRSSGVVVVVRGGGVDDVVWSASGSGPAPS
jgi:hypothetical protein